MTRIVNTVNLIILNDKNEILLLKRADTNDENDDFIGSYCIAGGGVEKNETFEEALTREIKEEVGVEIIEKKYFKSFYYVVNENLHARAVYFYGKMKGKIIINEESSSFDWFNLDEALDLELAFNQKDVLKEFVKFYRK